MNRFSNYYLTNIKPLNDELANMLGITPPTYIVVNQISEETPITVQSINDGYIDHCNHAGAELEEFTEYTGMGDNLQEFTVTARQCNKCEESL